MAQWAFAFEAGAAADIGLHGFDLGTQRRGIGCRGRAIDGDQRCADRSCNMHQPRIVTDSGIAGGEQIDGLGQTGLPGQDLALPLRGRR